MLTKNDWVLLALKNAPLDRIHLMKILFLMRYRTDKDGKSLDDFFTFEPYLYGPYSLDVYKALDAVEKDDLVVQPAHADKQHTPYYLSERGKQSVEEISKKASPEMLKLVESITAEVATLEFRDLLRKVYDEAPEFATESVMKGVL